MNGPPRPHELVLLGPGHTHLHVIARWRSAPLFDARLTCVSNSPFATYSGMLPGTLAGMYRGEQMRIDLARLCNGAGVRLFIAEANGLDRSRRRLLFNDRSPLAYDSLSIGVGSIPRGHTAVSSNPRVVAVKPMQTFLDRLDARLRQAAAEPPPARQPLRVAVVGAGAGGLEIALCLPRRVRHVCGDVPLELMLVDRAMVFSAGLSPRAARLGRRALDQRGIDLQLGREVVRVSGGAIELDGGGDLNADVVVWALGAAAPPLLESIDLPTDSRGFLLTKSTLQSTGDDRVFAVGDTGTIEASPTDKAGVYAVRQGPVLWENLRRTLHGEPPLAYRPQRSFLKLLNTGDGRAILDWKRVAVHAKWCWWLKDWIDRRFMAAFDTGDDDA